MFYQFFVSVSEKLNDYQIYFYCITRMVLNIVFLPSKFRLYMREFKKRSYLYVTIMFFAISWLVHGITAYNQFADEQNEHGQSFEMNAFWNEFIRQTTENWQSEL